MEQKKRGFVIRQNNSNTYERKKNAGLKSITHNKQIFSSYKKRRKENGCFICPIGTNLSEYYSAK